MKKIHNLRQGLFGLVLPRHFLKGHPFDGLVVDLGVTLPKGQGTHPISHALGHHLHKDVPKTEEEGHAHHEAQEIGHEGVHLHGEDPIEGDPCLLQAVDEFVVGETGDFCDLFRRAVLFFKDDGAVGDVDRVDLSRLKAFQKGPIVHCLHRLMIRQLGQDKEIKDKDRGDAEDVVEKHRWLAPRTLFFRLFHGLTYSFLSYVQLIFHHTPSSPL